MEKINIAELLEDCPQGMELDCTIFENLEFDHIDKNNGSYPIICRAKTERGCYNTHTFTEFGCYSTEKYSKCVIFPKGKTTWEGFQRPFKDGDIIYIRDEYSDATFTYVAILKHVEKEGRVYSHCFYNYESAEFSTDDYLYDSFNMRFATEEEKAKLFNTIKANGYKWNPETKTLEKLPKFKAGDRVRSIINQYEYTIVDIRKDVYIMYYATDKFDYHVPFCDEDKFDLVTDKFDITSLKPFDKVLVRDFDNTPWEIEFFSRLLDGKHFKCFDLSYVQCIPYEGNEHLLGKKDDCDEYFKTWK